MQVLKRFKSPSTALLSIPIASYCSIKRLLDKRLNSPQIPAFRMTTGIKHVLSFMPAANPVYAAEMT